MKAATEEFLYFLMWSFESLAKPGYLNCNNSFESWAYQNRLTRRLVELERRKLLKRHPGDSGGERYFCLTTRGRQAALLGVDPLERWARGWDQKWRLVIFDVPEANSSQRTKIRRFLRQSGFGYLQGSVWISPDSLEHLYRRLQGADVDAESLVFFEGRPCGGETNEQLVRAAWDFDIIAKKYEQWERIADRAPSFSADSQRNAKAILSWGKREIAAWRDIIQSDPFLPEELWPKNYPGKAIWHKRRAIWQALRASDSYRPGSV